RLALLTSADLVVALSPAVVARPSEEGRQMLIHFGSTTVKTSHPARILELLREQPLMPRTEGLQLIAYARGDIPTLIEGVLGLRETLPRVELLEITTHQHAPASLTPTILGYLPHWFNHLGLKTNIELLERVPRWLKAQLLTGG
ncbi:MAG: hypothetical protein ACK4Z6_07330, partial [Candidatus Methylomirabilales bacterium]